MPKDWLVTLVEYLEDFDMFPKCWQGDMFDPAQVPKISPTLVYFFASERCFDYFITNGLAGLLETEFGRMVPEWLCFLKYTGCLLSQRILRAGLDQALGDPFPRNDIRRSDGLRNMTVFDFLDSQVSKTLDMHIAVEQFEGRLHSFAEYHASRIGLSGREVTFLGNFTAYTHSPGEWERPIHAYVDG
jgi:hypothetical protein